MGQNGDTFLGLIKAKKNKFLKHFIFQMEIRFDFI